MDHVDWARLMLAVSAKKVLVLVSRFVRWNVSVLKRPFLLYFLEPILASGMIQCPVI